MGLANWLTVLRIALIPVFVSLLVYKRRDAALVVFVGAALTDLLDGWVARRRGSTRLGAFLDPMADKLLLAASFVTLAYLRALPFWIAAIVLSRDVVLVAGALAIHMAGGLLHPRPSWAGKAAALCQVLTVLAGLLARNGDVGVAGTAVMWLAAGFTLVSGLQYVRTGMRYLNAPIVEEDGAPHERPLVR